LRCVDGNTTGLRQHLRTRHPELSGSLDNRRMVCAAGNDRDLLRLAVREAWASK
jgi:hypothetical protein